MKNAIFLLWLQLVVLCALGWSSDSFPLERIAGTGLPGFSGDGGEAVQARLHRPHDIAVDNQGNLYIPDTNNHRIRQITPDGKIRTFAGTGFPGLTDLKGPARLTNLHFPQGVAVDDNGNVFAADTFNHRIVRIDPQGNLSTVAGTGQIGYSGDGGKATQARLSFPSDIFAAENGALYIFDTVNDVVRMVANNGIISTVAGNGKGGFSGDGAPAVQAQLKNPMTGLLDAQGNLWIADTGNKAIRKVDPDGIITTVVKRFPLQTNRPDDDGEDDQSEGDDNDDDDNEKSETLKSPTGIAFDQHGNLFIADSGNNRIYKRNPSGEIELYWDKKDFHVSQDDDDDDEEDQLIQFIDPFRITADSGNIYIVDRNRNRIWGIISKFEIEVTNPQIDAIVDNPVQLNVTVSGGEGGFTYKWVVQSGPDPSPEQFSDPHTAGPTFTPSKTGEYILRVTVTDSSGQTQSVQIKVIVHDRLTVDTANSSASVFLPNTAQLQAGASGGIGPLEYQWKVLNGPSTDPSQFSSTSAPNPAFTPDNVGVYTLEVQVKDNAGSLVRQQFQFTATQIITVNAGNDQKTYVGSAIQLEGSAAAPDDNLVTSWEITAGPNTSPTQFTNDGTFTPQKQGQYTLKFTASDGFSSPVSDTLTVQVFGILSVSISGTTKGIANDSFPLFGNVTGGDGNFQYEWSIVSGPSNDDGQLITPQEKETNFIPIVAGLYSVKLLVRDGLNQQASRTVLIEVFPPIQIDINNTFKMVEGSSIALQPAVSGGAFPLMFQWDVLSGPDKSRTPFSQPASKDTQFTPTQEGSYQVQLTVTDFFQETHSDPIEIQVFPLIQVNVVSQQNQSIDVGTSTTLEAQASGGTGNFTYQWQIVSGPNLDASQFSTSTEGTTVFTPKAVGEYEIAAAVGDELQPPVTGTIKITSRQTLSAHIETEPLPAAMVRGGTITLQSRASGALGAIQYKWSVKSGPTKNPNQFSAVDIPNPRFSPLTRGAYVLQLLVNDGIQPPAGATVSIKVFDPLNVDAGTNRAGIINEATQLQGHVEGGSGNYQVEWSVLSGPDQGADLFGAPNELTTTFTPTQAGTYHIQLAAHDQSLGSVTDTAKFIAYAPLAVEITPSREKTYEGSGITFTSEVSGGTGFNAFEWQILSGPTSNRNLFSRPSASETEFKPALPGDYEIALTVQDGFQTAVSAPFSLEVFKRLQVSVGGQHIVQVSRPTRIDGQVNGGTGDFQFSWRVLSAPENGAYELADASSEDTLFTPIKQGVYQLGFSVNDGLQPVKEATAAITAQLPVSVAASPDLALLVEEEGILSATASGGDGTFDYQWRLLSGPVLDASQIRSATSADAVFVPQAVGNYQIEVQVNDGHLPAATAVLNATVNAFDFHITSSTSLVFGRFSQFQVDIQGPQDDYFFEWKIASGPSTNINQLTSEFARDPSFFPEAVGEYTFELTITNTDDVSLTQSISISVFELFEIDAGISRFIIVNQTIPLSGKASGGKGDFTVSWRIKSGPNINNRQLSQTSTFTPDFTPVEVGLYVLEMTVTDALFGTQTDTVSVQAVGLNTASQVLVTDNLETLQDLSGGEDFDPPHDAGLVIRWFLAPQKIDDSDIKEVQVYVRKGDSENFQFLGSVDDPDQNHLSWSRLTPANLAPQFQKGPPFDTPLRFIIYVVTQSRNPPFFGPISNNGAVVLREESVQPPPAPGAPTATPTLTATPTPTPLQNDDDDDSPSGGQPTATPTVTPADGVIDNPTTTATPSNTPTEGEDPVEPNEDPNGGGNDTATPTPTSPNNSTPPNGPPGDNGGNEPTDTPTPTPSGDIAPGTTTPTATPLDSTDDPGEGGDSEKDENDPESTPTPDNNTPPAGGDDPTNDETATPTPVPTATATAAPGSPDIGDATDTPTPTLIPTEPPASDTPTRTPIVDRPDPNHTATPTPTPNIGREASGGNGGGSNGDSTPSPSPVPSATPAGNETDEGDSPSPTATPTVTPTPTAVVEDSPIAFSTCSLATIPIARTNENGQLVTGTGYQASVPQGELCMVHGKTIFITERPVTLTAFVKVDNPGFTYAFGGFTDIFGQRHSVSYSLRYEPEIKVGSWQKISIVIDGPYTAVQPFFAFFNGNESSQSPGLVFFEVPEVKTGISTFTGVELPLSPWSPNLWLDTQGPVGSAVIDGDAILLQKDANEQAARVTAEFRTGHFPADVRIEVDVEKIKGAEGTLTIWSGNGPSSFQTDIPLWMLSENQTLTFSVDGRFNEPISPQFVVLQISGEDDQVVQINDVRVVDVTRP